VAFVIGSLQQCEFAPSITKEGPKINIRTIKVDLNSFSSYLIGSLHDSEMTSTIVDVIRSIENVAIVKKDAAKAKAPVSRKAKSTSSTPVQGSGSDK
jgi:hypothetical protein